MLRGVVVLLVLANALTWAWGQGQLDFLGWGRPEQREPQRLAQQIAPERILVVDGRPAADPSASPPAAPAGEPGVENRAP